MENKKNKIMTLLGIVAILITVIGLTYAFFAPQQGGTTSMNATVTSNTTDLLTFSINRDISFTVTQALFAQNGTNQSGDATATATLTPNNKTGAATMNYYLYLNLQSNPTVYSEANTNEDPELMLQVFDGNNQLVTLTGLGTQKTIKGVTGYDITGVSGLKTLLDNHAISASNNMATIENWRIVITLINLDVNQNDNTGKEVSAQIIISKEEVNVGFTGTIYRNNRVMASAGSSIIPVTGTQWVMTDGTQDYFNYSDQATCNAKLIELNAPNTIYCEEKSGAFGGVGSYETNVNTIRTKTYNVYCPIGEDYQTCTNSWYYLTEEDCLDDVDTGVYTCTAGTITRPYYLKHEVEENEIESTEACLWYNNHEFCLGPNYWVETGNGNAQHESAENGVATKNKLQTAMETALGTQADSCSSGSVHAGCYFGDFRCGADADGYVDCYDGGGYCEVNGDGSSGCG